MEYKEKSVCDHTYTSFFLAGNENLNDPPTFDATRTA
jgi:hypothetical protein